MIDNALHSIIVEDIKTIVDAPLPWEDLRGASVLISGASGMVASYLVYTLLQLNDERDLGINVVAIVRNPEKAKQKMGKLLEREDIMLLTQDVSDPVPYDGPVDIIIHAASPANPRFFASDPVGTIRANAQGTANLLELAREKNTKRFLFLSSSEVYGKAGDGGLLGEDAFGLLDSASARSCYPESKRLAETLCAAYAQQYGLVCHIARIAHIYGPSMDRDDGHVFAEFMRCALDGKDMVIKSDGLAERVYVYVSDVALGLFTILLKGSGFVYNLTNEEQAVSIRALAAMMAGVFPEKNLKVSFKEPPPGTNTGFLSYKVGLLSGAKLRGLGWKPTISLEEGISRTISVFK